MSDVQAAVAVSADTANLHATVPALLLELQSQLGALAAAASAATERGRRPFRPDQAWQQRLGELAYGLYLMADQSAVDLDREVLATADAIRQRAELASRNGGPGDWPFNPA
jgi:hypothetical protein